MISFEEQIQKGLCVLFIMLTKKICVDVGPDRETDFPKDFTIFHLNDPVVELE